MSRPTAEEVKAIEPGDRITFRAVTRWSGAKATRIVRWVDRTGTFRVHYGGWYNFVVKPTEILEIHKKEAE